MSYMDAMEDGETGETEEPLDPSYGRYTKVTGKFLTDHINEPVSFIGKVKAKISEDTYEVITTDDVVVKVKENGGKDLTGWVEIKGIQESKYNVVCQNPVWFDDEMFEDFDKKLYNEVISAINSVDNPFTSEE